MINYEMLGIIGYPIFRYIQMLSNLRVVLLGDFLHIAHVPLEKWGTQCQYFHVRL